MSRPHDEVTEARAQELADEYEYAISDCYDGGEFVSSLLLLNKVTQTREEWLLVTGWALADASAFGVSGSELLFSLASEGSVV